MKRTIGVLLSLCLLVGLSGCTGGSADNTVKLGVGADAAYTVKDEQTATVETTWAAVLLDANDRILSCRIDAISSEVRPGVPDVSFTTKYDLKENYGMVAYAGAEKEWYQQIDIFCEAVVGKTLEEAMNLQPGEGDLSAGCTVSVLPYQYALAKACQNAVAVKADAADPLSVELRGSATAGEDADEFEFSFAAVTADAVVSACRYDAVQLSIAKENGAYSKGATGAGYKTKRELGYDYGMVAYAGAKYEWFEQVDALEAAAVGKTPDEIAALADDTGKVTGDVDLASKATIYVGGILGQIVAAASK